MMKIVLIAFLACNVLFSFSSYGNNLPKILILTGNGNESHIQAGNPPWIHPIHQDIVKDILSEVADVTITSNLNDLNEQNLSSYDLLISYSLFLRPSQSQLDALYDFIAGGKKLMTIHCGILSFLNWQEYEKVIGGIFIGGPSTEPLEFKVATENIEFWGYPYSFRTQQQHPVSEFSSDFVIEDEMYFFQTSSPEIQVIARAENHPVMWWHPFLEGGVMSLTLGHSIEAKLNPGYQQLLLNGVKWLLGYPLIRNDIALNLSNRNDQYLNILELDDHVFSPESSPLNFTIGGQNTIQASVKDRKLNLLGVNRATTDTIFVTATSMSGKMARGSVQVKVIPDGEGNIAAYHGNAVTASSTETNVLFRPEYVSDGNPETRWASDFIDPSHVQIDLQKNYDFNNVKIFWEASYASDYNMEVSDDGKNWQIVKRVRGSDGEVDNLTFPMLSARYLRVTGLKRARLPYPYSIFEIEIYKSTSNMPSDY